MISLLWHTNDNLLSQSKKKHCPVILIPIIANHKQNIFYCIITLWNNVRNLLL